MEGHGVDRVVVVTGAGSGIGRATVLAFLQAGYRVAASDIAAAKLAETAALAGEPDRLSTAACDVRDDAAVRSMIGAALDRFGQVDAVCNSAGVLDGFLLADEVTDAVWDRVLGVNLTGTMHVCRAVLPHMDARGGGSIVNLSSIAGVRGGRAGLAYTTSKHALIGLTRSIAASFMGRGIRCNAILPGYVDTPIAAGGTFSAAGLALREKVLGSRPAATEAARIADIALFLASPAADYINGATIVADGGWTTL